jgi:hypothetical protein
VRGGRWYGVDGGGEERAAGSLPAGPTSRAVQQRSRPSRPSACPAAAQQPSRPSSRPWCRPSGGPTFFFSSTGGSGTLMRAILSVNLALKENRSSLVMRFTSGLDLLSTLYLTSAREARHLRQREGGAGVCIEGGRRRAAAALPPRPCRPTLQRAPPLQCGRGRPPVSIPGRRCQPLAAASPSANRTIQNSPS